MLDNLLIVTSLCLNSKLPVTRIVIRQLKSIWFLKKIKFQHQNPSRLCLLGDFGARFTDPISALSTSEVELIRPY